jgi:hypothetical protein
VDRGRGVSVYLPLAVFIAGSGREALMTQPLLWR